MSILYVSEFARQHQPTNAHFEQLVAVLLAFEQRCGHGTLLIARKANDLPEIVDLILERGRFPVVDKPSKCVFGLPPGNHERFRGMLYALHDPDSARMRIEIVNAARYLALGYGYYISSMSPAAIVCATGYTADRYDKRLFAARRVTQIWVPT